MQGRSEGDWPVLRLNNTAGGRGSVDTLDNHFLALVFPEVMRQILSFILIENEHTDPDCHDDWPSLWLQMAGSLPGMSPPQRLSKAGRYAWIDKATEAFCASSGLLEKFIGRHFGSKRGQQ